MQFIWKEAVWISAAGDEILYGLQIFQIQTRKLVDNEVTIIIWTKLDIDISFVKRSLWCRLISIAVMSGA